MCSQYTSSSPQRSFFSKTNTLFVSNNQQLRRFCVKHGNHSCKLDVEIFYGCICTHVDDNGVSNEIKMQNHFLPTEALIMCDTYSVHAKNGFSRTNALIDAKRHHAASNVVHSDLRHCTNTNTNTNTLQDSKSKPMKHLDSSRLRHSFLQLTKETVYWQHIKHQSTAIRGLHIGQNA